MMSYYKLVSNKKLTFESETGRFRKLLETSYCFLSVKQNEVLAFVLGLGLERDIRTSYRYFFDIKLYLVVSGDAKGLNVYYFGINKHTYIYISTEINETISYSR